jgi:hypothetical protein
MVAALQDSDEKTRVENHRRQFFREILGKDIPADDIEQLVHSTVSPHDAKRLRDQGWPPQFIVAVLL